MAVEWDPLKTRLNLAKHRAAFEDAVAVFDDTAALVIEDPRHPEQRFVAIGAGKGGRLLTVVFAYRERDLIRIISARFSSRRETRTYYGGPQARAR